ASCAGSSGSWTSRSHRPSWTDRPIKREPDRGLRVVVDDDAIPAALLAEDRRLAYFRAQRQVVADEPLHARAAGERVLGDGLGVERRPRLHHHHAVAERAVRLEAPGER